jgi:sporulation protein YlmC with PRC-barrel domain
MILASDLLGCVVRTEAGTKVGRVRELRAEERDGALRLVELVMGPRGVFERYGVVGSARREPSGDAQAVPWTDVVRLEDGVVTVRGD